MHMRGNEGRLSVFEEVEVKKRETTRRERRRTLRRKTLSVLGGGVCWYVLSHTVVPLVPDPIVTISRSLYVIQQPWYYESIGYSIFRVFGGFLLGAAVGVPLGLMIGWNRIVHDFIFPTFEVIRPIPPISWVPLSLLMFVYVELSIMWLPFMGALSSLLLNAKLGAEQIDPSLFRAAQCLGARPHQIFRHIVLPGALPAIFTGFTIGMGAAWMTVVGAEMIAGEYGIGYLVWQSYNLIRYHECILAMVTIGLLGYGSSAMIRLLGNKFLAWKKVYTTWDIKR
ncbi:MAG: Bicarbonate transport system permease protein CmpB [Syntrophomonadaceae bacterium]|nr:Bicarbonate transport system permease protein CmpB [Bacillota bacterium]